MFLGNELIAQPLGKKQGARVMLAEEKLLLCSARIDITSEQKKLGSSLIAGGIDWELFAKKAVWHNLISIVCRNYKKNCPGVLPAEIDKAFSGVATTNAAKNLFLCYALEIILGELRAVGVDAVPFKGPALALLVYSDLSARCFSDLDILIDRASLKTASGILKTMGYRAELNLNHEQLLAFSYHEDNLTFYHKDGVVVELHWELSGLYLARPVTLQDLLSSLVSINLTEGKAPHLPINILLVYLSVHGAKHMWEKLEWLVCVHELVGTATDKEWSLALELAGAWRCRRMFFLGLSLCRELFDTELPADIMVEIKKDPHLVQLAQQIKSLLFQGDKGEEDKSGGKRFTLFHLQVRDSLVDSIRYLLRLLFRPSRVEWQLFPLPASLSFLYYIVRPLRLIFVGFKLGVGCMVSR